MPTLRDLFATDRPAQYRLTINGRPAIPGLFEIGGFYSVVIIATDEDHVISQLDVRPDGLDINTPSSLLEFPDLFEIYQYLSLQLTDTAVLKVNMVNYRPAGKLPDILRKVLGDESELEQLGFVFNSDDGDIVQVLSGLRTRPLGAVYDRILEYVDYDDEALQFVSSELDSTKTFGEAIQKACDGARCISPLIHALIEGVSSVGDFDTHVYFQSKLRVDVEINGDTINFRKPVSAQPRPMGDSTGGKRTKRKRSSKVNRKVGRW